MYRLFTDFQYFYTPNVQVTVDEVICDFRKQNQLQVFIKGNGDEYRQSYVKSEGQTREIFQILSHVSDINGMVYDIFSVSYGGYARHHLLP
jgi:hypothetical protein